MPWFPTVEWYDAYRETLNENTRFRSLIDDWGEDFDGDFLFEIRDVPVDEHRLDEVPDEMLASTRCPTKSGTTYPKHSNVKSNARASTSRSTSRSTYSTSRYVTPSRTRPANSCASPRLFSTPTRPTSKLSRKCPTNSAVSSRPISKASYYQLENFVTDDGDAFAYLDIEDGRVVEARALEPGEAEEIDAGFHLRGDYDDWEYFTKSDETVIGVVMDEVLKPEGQMLTLMEYADALNEMGETRHDVETRYIFDVASDETETEETAAR